MRTRARELFTTVTTEGAILPADILQRIADGDRDLEGLRGEDYHLPGEKIGEATRVAHGTGWSPRGGRFRRCASG